MLRIIGDTHGKFSAYKSIVDRSDCSIQLGDFGFASAWNSLIYSDLDPSDHKVLAGNHDDYDLAPQSPFYLGDFGTSSLGGEDFFYVRGGLSIDRTHREVDRINLGHKTWWSQEELSFEEMLGCMEAYRKAKPSIVVSHVPCAMFSSVINSDDSILQRFGFHEGFKEATQLLGDKLLEIHKPKMWFSGHMHKSCNRKIGKTTFISLAELEYFDI